MSSFSFSVPVLIVDFSFSNNDSVLTVSCSDGNERVAYTRFLDVEVLRHFRFCWKNRQLVQFGAFKPYCPNKWFAIIKVYAGAERTLNLQFSNKIDKYAKSILTSAAEWGVKYYFNTKKDVSVTVSFDDYVEDYVNGNHIGIYKSKSKRIAHINVATKNREIADVLRTLFHELTHYHQHATERLVNMPEVTLWKEEEESNIYEHVNRNEVSYINYPWEKEARTEAEKALDKFIKVYQ